MSCPSRNALFFLLRQSLYADVLEEDRTVGVMALQAKRALVQDAGEVFRLRLLIFRLGVIDNDFVIHFDDDVLAFDANRLSPPFVVFGGGGVDVDDAVEAAGLFGVTVGVVDLGFVAVFGPSRFLVLCVEIDARVAAFEGHDVDSQFKIHEVFFVAREEQVAAFAFTNQRAVFDLPGVFVFAGFPTFEGLSIPQGFESLFNFSNGLLFVLLRLFFVVCLNCSRQDRNDG